jgi:hypothetical protein
MFGQSEKDDYKESKKEKEHGKLRNYMQPFTAIALRDAIKF